MNRIWCGYYDGNEKSRRVQEKLGFIYQRKTEVIEMSLLGGIRTGHSNLMTRSVGRRLNCSVSRKICSILSSKTVLSLGQSTIKALATWSS